MAKLRTLTIITIAAIVYYWKILLVHQFSDLLGYEGANQTYAWLTYWVTSIRAGCLPVWDPFTFAGHSFAGEMQTAAFYPLHAIYLLVPFHNGMLPPQAYHVVYVLTHILCAWLTFCLARELRLTEFSALVSGICFSFGGFLCHIQEWPHLLESGVWLPAIFWGLLRAQRAPNAQSRATFAALAGAALALSILAGGLHLAIMQAMVIVSVVAYQALETRPASWRRAAATLLIVFAIALAGGAAQILPSMEYSRRAIRFTGAAAIPANQRIPFAYLGDAVNPSAVLSMIAPAFNGPPSTGEYVNPYLGVFPLALALIAVSMRKRDRWVTYFSGLAVAAFLYSMGGVSLLYGLLYAVAPFLSLAREADRFLYLADFAIALLAGYGLDALLAHHPDARWHDIHRLFRWAAIAAAAALAWPAILGHGDLSPWIAISLLFILLTFGLFRYVAARGDGRWQRFLIVSLILFDLSAFDWSAANRIDAAAKHEDHFDNLRRAGALARFLRTRPAPFRVDIAADLPPNIGDAFHIETTRGAGVTLDAGFDKIHGLTDLLNARYVVRPASAKDPGAIYQDADWKVYENSAAFPRAWLVHRTEVEPDAGKTYARLQDRSLDLHTVALVATPLKTPLPIPPPGMPDGEVTVGRPRNDELRVRVHSPIGALLVLSELDYPGWRATVNGAPATILKVDGDLRGVRVPCGWTTVTLHYWPASVYAGLTLSALAFGAVTILLYQLRWPRHSVYAGALPLPA